MKVPVLEEEQIFIDYLDDESLDWGLRLVDNAPKEAIDAFNSYIDRYNQLKKYQKISE